MKLFVFSSIFLVMGIGASDALSAGLGDLITLRLVLDSTNLLAGEPISGEVVLENSSNSPIGIHYEGNSLFSNVAYEISGPEIEVSVRPYEIFGFVWGESLIREHIVPSEGQVRELVFLLSYYENALGTGDDSSSVVKFVTINEGVVHLAASLELIDDNGAKELIRSAPVSISVSPPALGYEMYMDAVGLSPRNKPFQLAPFASPSSFKDYGDYDGALQTVYAYQYGLRLGTLLYNRKADPHRDKEFVLESIVGGMVGSPDLIVNKWRKAMLQIYDGIYGSSQLKALGNAENYDSFLLSIPLAKP